MLARQIIHHSVLYSIVYNLASAFEGQCNAARRIYKNQLGPWPDECRVFLEFLSVVKTKKRRIGPLSSLSLCFRLVTRHSLSTLNWRGAVRRNSNLLGSIRTHTSQSGIIQSAPLPELSIDTNRAEAADESAWKPISLVAGELDSISFSLLRIDFRGDRL